MLAHIFPLRRHPRTTFENHISHRSDVHIRKFAAQDGTYIIELTLTHEPIVVTAAHGHRFVDDTAT